jgi:DsbE subfamily thiol:disulfide oxidoreductase
MRRLRLIALLLASAPLLQAATIGRLAPKFTLQDAQAKPRTLASYKGKVVLINFWASWCGPCQAELPELNRLAAQYKARNVRVLAINVDRDRSQAKQLLKRLGLGAPALEILWDPHSKAVSAYDIQGMPSSFVLDRAGVIRYLHSGFQPHDPSLWRNELEALLRS